MRRGRDEFEEDARRGDGTSRRQRRRFITVAPTPITTNGGRHRRRHPQPVLRMEYLRGEREKQSITLQKFTLEWLRSMFSEDMLKV